MSPHFELQGHRGPAALKPENTLSSFEAAFDHGVAAVETDLHLTQDGRVVVCHEPLLNNRFCSWLPFPEGTPISRLTLAQLRAAGSRAIPTRSAFPIRMPRSHPWRRCSPNSRASIPTVFLSSPIFSLLPPRMRDTWVNAPAKAPNSASERGKCISISN